jgi:ceramide glucosyltransferase
MHRQAIGAGAYFAELLLNPIVLALVALGLDPQVPSLFVFLTVCLVKMAVDTASQHALVPEQRWSPLFLVLPKDLVLGAVWFYGLCHSHVEWRGHRLKVYRGTWLRRVEQGRPLPATALEAY